MFARIVKFKILLLHNNNMGLDSIIRRRLSLLYPKYEKSDKFWKIERRAQDFNRETRYDVPKFDEYMRKYIDEIVDSTGVLDRYTLPYVTIAAAVYELYKRDPHYFDFVKPGNVTEEAYKTFDYLLNQGKAKEVYQRLSEFLEKPLSQVPEFQRIVEFIDKYGFRPYREDVNGNDSKVKFTLSIIKDNDIISAGIGVYSSGDKYKFEELNTKVEKELLPAFARVIAKKTEEYLNRLGYQED
ncbi:hypothetical protein P8X24_07185 [Pyrococcus kukulkanii]|uniref:hypothetical protein n=1 Tax=Pyrococcus kukulkanii TaxID=1609559 RepID=UPI003567EECE